jgi:multiple sugar transport system substrate-binding protein
MMADPLLGGGMQLHKRLTGISSSGNIAQYCSVAKQISSRGAMRRYGGLAMQSEVRKSRSFDRRTLVKGAAASAAAPLIFSPRSVLSARQNVSGEATMWVYPLAGGEAGRATWDGIVADFNEQYPNANISVEIQPWAQRNEKLLVALAAGAGPDVAYLNDDFIPQHAEEGNIVALDDLLADAKEDFFEHVLVSASYNDQLFTAPILTTSNTVVYNTNVFEEAGVTTYPETWDQLLEVAPAFKAQGLYVTQYVGSLEQTLNLTFYPKLWQAGGTVLNEEGTEPTLDSEAGLDALSFIVQLFENEYVPPSLAVTTPDPGQSPLDQGQAALGMVMGANDPIILGQTWGEGAIRVGAPLEREIRTSYGTMAGFSLFSHAADNEVARAWISYLISPEVAPTILGMGNYMPARQSMQGLYADDPILGAFEEQLPFMRPGVRHPAARQIIAIVSPYIQGAILGRASARDRRAGRHPPVEPVVDALCPASDDDCQSMEAFESGACRLRVHPAGPGPVPHVQGLAQFPGVHHQLPGLSNLRRVRVHRTRQLPAAAR